MSYDVVLHRFLNGNGSDVACEPALSILRAACQDPDGETFDNGYNIALRDGSHQDIDATGIMSGSQFGGIGFTTRTRKFSPLVITLMFDLARLSDMVIINSGGEVGNSIYPMILLVSERQRNEVLSGWGEGAILCGSTQQLAAILDASFERWHGYAYTSRDSLA